MNNKKFIPLIVITLFWSLSCSDEFLEVTPPGSYSTPSLQNARGVEGMLISAYSALDGSWFESWGNAQFNQNGGASNWIWGGVRSDVAYKGTEPSDGVDINPIERAEVQPSNPYLGNKWNASYDGVGRANAALEALQGEDVRAELGEERALQIEGEARFLRAHFIFEAVKVFKNAPFVPEGTQDFAAISNSAGPPWAELEADLQFAYDNLPDQMSAEGRVNRAAAGAMLGKVYMFQGKYSDALTVFTDVINNGTTSAGTPLALTPRFHDNFRADMEAGNTEIMFAYEASFGDGTIANGNYENTLNQPHGSAARTACCGFFQPSQDLVNSYLVDANGLPMLDTYRSEDFVTDEGVAADADFTPEDSPLDARIDWTVGRRGIPFLDWGINPGSTSGYVRNVPNGGIYNPVKTVPTIAEFDAALAGVIDWGFTSTAKNVNIIRFADVLLLGAEAAAETGDLGTAVEWVDMVRERAANTNGWVTNEDGSFAANYNVGLYGSFSSQAEALQAIRFERKLELAMEGHRMFDLVRWHENSSSSALAFDAVAYMNDYLSTESEIRNHLSGASFSETYLYMPIPTDVITQSTVEGVQNIVQNPGY